MLNSVSRRLSMRVPPWLRVTIFAAMAILICGCRPVRERSASERVVVLAAASLSDAIKEASSLFKENNPGLDVVVSTGPSNALAQQILAGAPADVFISANPNWAAIVAERGFAAETVPLLSNRMVLIVPDGNPGGLANPAQLASPQIKRVAIADDNVPAGVYARQALATLGLYEALNKSNRLARGSDVRVTLAYVERGEAEAGVVYATDARISDLIEVVAELDPDAHDRVLYPAVLLTSASEKNAVRRYFEFLKGPAARAVFERYGFSYLSEPMSKQTGE